MAKKICGALSALLTFALIMLAVALAGIRLFGLTPYVVCSGSMAPRYPVGSLIYVRGADPEQVRAGDVITFRTGDSAATILPVATHQVWLVDAAEQRFYTQGIANLDSNGAIIHDGEPVPFTALLGRPVFCVPLLGYLAQWIVTPAGRGCIVLGLLATLLLDLPARLARRGAEAARRKQTENCNT